MSHDPIILLHVSRTKKVLELETNNYVWISWLIQQSSANI